MGKLTYMLVPALLAGMLVAGGAAAKEPRRADPAKILGSKARQLLLKQALEKHLSGTLVAELNRNKRDYRALSPEQRRALRQRVYAILKMDPQRQAKIIDAGREFLNLSDQQKKEYQQRLVWLKKVVASLSPEQREALKRMTPAERAKRLLELKVKLVDTQPTSRQGATTAPAQ